MSDSKTHTRGPWKVMTHHYSTGAIEREICTEWEHGQLKGPVPVVGLAVDANGPLVSISKEDAELIASAPTLLDRVQQLEKENEELRQIISRAAASLHDAKGDYGNEDFHQLRRRLDDTHRAMRMAIS